MVEPSTVEYAVELEATFDVVIFSVVTGRPGLDQNGVERLIERDWAWVSGDKNILLESSWNLVTFEQRTPK